MITMSIIILLFFLERKPIFENNKATTFLESLNIDLFLKERKNFVSFSAGWLEAMFLIFFFLIKFLNH